MPHNRFLILVAGLFGAAGIALSAAAAHSGGANSAIAANILLVHAPALLAAGLIGTWPVLRVGAWVLAIGAVMFAADLLARDHLGSRLFPFAAPASGVLMIAGWLGIALAPFTGRARID